MSMVVISPIIHSAIPFPCISLDDPRLVVPSLQDRLISSVAIFISDEHTLCVSNNSNSTHTFVLRFLRFDLTFLAVTLLALLEPNRHV